MQQFTFYTDPGHGWLEVSFADMTELGLTPADFSQYSYRSGEYAFLEEDCDAPVFLDAYTQIKGVKPNFRDVHTNSDSIIRTYKRLK